MSAGAERPKVCLVIPALDEAGVIGPVVASVPRPPVDEVIVVDNGSTDATGAEAATAGATVIREPTPGYGRACRAGARQALANGAGVVAFMDGDGSDRPEFLSRVIEPVARGACDFALGSRVRGECEPGSLNQTQRVAGALAGALIWLRYGVRFTDMSPVRAVRAEALRGLPLQELTYGWNLEMQMLAAAQGLRIMEVPVGQRCRQGGVSKVSGRPKVVLRAAWRIGLTFGRVALRPGR